MSSSGDLMTAAQNKKAKLKENLSVVGRTAKCGVVSHTRFERIGASLTADGTDASIEARITNQYQSPYVVLP
jgi:hypothetical protein